MVESEGGQIDDLISEYGDRLRTIVSTAKRLLGEGVSSELIADRPEIAEPYWQLGLVGARLDEAMTAAVGIRAPVMASYDAFETHGDQDDDESNRRESVVTDDRVTARLEFVVAKGDRSESQIVSAIDGAGESVVESLASAGLEVVEWGSSAD
jgi:hypothetical protein